MNQQPGFLILVVIVAVIAGGWLFIQMVGGCIALLGIGLGTSPEFAVIGGFFLAIALTVFALTRKGNK